MTAFLVIVLAVFWVGPASGRSEASPAPTVTQQRAEGGRQFIRLKRLTGGPADQLNGVFFGSDEGAVVMTVRSSQTRHVARTDLRTGSTSPIVDVQADSDSPRVSRSGRLAFISFRSHARGQVCVGRIEGPHQCLTRGREISGVLSDLFWMDEDHVGFLERPLGLSEARIWKQSTRLDQTELLATGPLWSPWQAQGGRRLVWFERRGLVVQEGQQRSVISLPMPGIPGFAVSSLDEESIYFSHFFNDTNQDRFIDGSDNGVIFRIDLKTHKLEQLTSAATSCSYPSLSPSQSRLLVTCDFEGSLDLYELPASGLVPAEWSVEVLEDVLLSARTPQDQVLALSAIGARGGAANLDRRYLSAFVQAQEWKAAEYYAERLKDSEILSYIKARLQDPIGSDLSDADRTRLRSTRAGFTRGTLAWSYLSLRLGLNFIEPLAKRLKERPVRLTPLAGHIALELLDMATAQTPSRIKFVRAKEDWTLSTELTEQNQLAYASALLTEAKSSREVELSQLARNPRLEPLVRAELALRVILDPGVQNSDVKRRTAQQTLDQILISPLSSMQRRAIASRAIRALAGAQQLGALNQVTSQWLKLTPKESAEFVFAREAFRDVVLDIAYRHQRRSEHLLAASYFYQSILLTDDLESHHGYVLSMVSAGQEEAIESRYSNLLSRNQVGQSADFARVLREILVRPVAKESDERAWSRRLEAMRFVANDAMHALVLGTLYLRLFERERLPEDAKSARRHFEQSLDLGFERHRLLATALRNLVLLEMLDSQPQSSLLAYERLIRVDPDSRSSPELVFTAARAAQRTGRNSSAVQLLSSLATRSNQERLAWLERRALNRLLSDDTTGALTDYESFFSNNGAAPAGPRLAFAAAVLRKRRDSNEASRVRALDQVEKALASDLPPRALILGEALRGHLLRDLGRSDEARSAYARAERVAQQSSKELSQDLLFRARKLIQIMNLPSATPGDRAEVQRIRDQFLEEEDEALLLSPELFHLIWSDVLWPLWHRSCVLQCRTQRSHTASLQVLIVRVLGAYQSLAALKASTPEIDFRTRRLRLIQSAFSSQTPPSEIETDPELKPIWRALRASQM